MRKNDDRARPAIEPRLLSKAAAATYCGLTSGGYDAWVRAGRLPGPIAGTHRYDRKAIDSALDRLSGLTSRQADLDEAERWLEEHGY